MVLTEKRGNEQEEKPKPQHGINLLVYDVQRHHTESVVLLDRTTRTELVEHAFCHLQQVKTYFEKRYFCFSLNLYSSADSKLFDLNFIPDSALCITVKQI